jgi:hypothetical protein
MLLTCEAKSTIKTQNENHLTAKRETQNAKLKNQNAKLNTKSETQKAKH